FNCASVNMYPYRAMRRGLVDDVTVEEYVAFACGRGSPAVDGARCDALATDGLSFDPADLNQPSIALSRLTKTRTVTRRVTNVSEATGTYTVAIEPPPGISVLVSPSTLSIAPGQSAEFEVTLGYESGTLDLWRFGSLTWRGDGHAVRSVLAVRPSSINAPAEVFGQGGSGSGSFPIDFGYTGPYTARVHGMAPAFLSQAEIAEDPNRTFTF